MICILIPAYNEEQNLARLLDSIRIHAPKAGMPFRVLIVDDGSTDGTVLEAKKYETCLSVHIERHAANLGVGCAFRTGFRSALAVCNDDSIIVTLEADNTSDLSLLPVMVKRIGEGADVVLASCFAPGGGLQGVSFLRMFMSHSLNALLRVLFPMKDAHTYSSFYRAYKSVTLQKAVNAFGDTFIKSPGFAAAAEILIKLRRLGARIDEIPMVLKYDERAGSSKMNVWKTILEYLVLLSRETAVEVAHRPGRTDRRIP